MVRVPVFFNKTFLLISVISIIFTSYCRFGPVITKSYYTSVFMNSSKKAIHISGSYMRVFLLLLCLVFAMPAQKCAAQYNDDYLSYDDFYQSLAPYGQWIEDPQYGYVWSPGEDANFRPYYTNGHWVMTEYGNTWVSDYQWGWACFHYGRWTYDNYYGWLWIPGNYWGPAWVSWRVGEGFYGWAPLGPDYRDGSSLTSYNCPGDWWVFIPPRYIHHDHYYQYWNGPRDNKKNIKNTRIISNTMDNGGVTYYTGPQIAHVKQVTGNPVQVFKVRNSTNQTTRLHNDVVRMYRPAEIRQIAKVNGAETRPPDVVVAPKPVRAPMAVSTTADQTPPFRTTVNERKKQNAIIPGTNINQVAEPQKQPKKTDNNPYEWDVNRHVKQEYTPAPKPRTAPTPPARPANPRQPVRQQQPARESVPQRAPGTSTRESGSVPASNKPQGGR